MKRVQESYKGPALSRGVSLPRDLWEALQERAMSEDRKISTLIRRAVIADFEAGMPPEPGGRERRRDART